MLTGRCLILGLIFAFPCTFEHVSLYINITLMLWEDAAELVMKYNGSFTVGSMYCTAAALLNEKCNIRKLFYSIEGHCSRMF